MVLTSKKLWQLTGTMEKHVSCGQCAHVEVECICTVLDEGRKCVGRKRMQLEVRASEGLQCWTSSTQFAS
jgi:hypothetical protein